MCGILTLVYEESDEETAKKLIAVLELYLKRRGSDVCGSAVSRSAGVVVEGSGCVLNMRGRLTEQPLRDAATGDWLLWNGEVFGGEVQVSDSGNDTEVMLRVLSSCEDETTILRTISSVHGPWAIIYWQASTQTLWFGRDVLGRRSLLWHHPAVSDNVFALSSVACCSAGTPLDYWSEVPAGGLYRLQFTNSRLHSSRLVCHPWADKNGLLFRTQLQTELASIQSCWNLSILQLTIQTPFTFLNRALPPPTTTPATSSNDDHTERDVANSVLQPVGSEQWRQDAHELLCFLEEAVRKRIVSAPVVVQPSSCSAASSLQEPVDKLQHSLSRHTNTSSAGPVRQGMARVAILYSGGVDSAVMVALVDRCLPVCEEVDLINVAFIKTPADNKCTVPDRLTAIDSLRELNPLRRWNLVLVNVSVEELNQLRQEHISHLVYPLNTVLDDSLGCAMWFAARGEGLLYTATKLHPEIIYRSGARVVLVGIGADEQLAGYSRHRTRFKTHGWAGVLDEIEADIKRLSSRNLGRDDRCIGDHQREARFPFLDEEVVDYLHKLPIWRKADLALPRGEGDKRLLRKVATMLGCGLAARLPKKAMQFGSHMAKIVGSAGGKEHGHEICSRLKHH